MTWGFSPGGLQWVMFYLSYFFLNRGQKSRGKFRQKPRWAYRSFISTKICWVSKVFYSISGLFMRGLEKALESIIKTRSHLYQAEPSKEKSQKTCLGNVSLFQVMWKFFYSYAELPCVFTGNALLFCLLLGFPCDCLQPKKYSCGFHGKRNTVTSKQRACLTELASFVLLAISPPLDIWNAFSSGLLGYPMAKWPLTLVRAMLLFQPKHCI